MIRVLLGRLVTEACPARVAPGSRLFLGFLSLLCLVAVLVLVLVFLFIVIVIVIPSREGSTAETDKLIGGYRILHLELVGVVDIARARNGSPALVARDGWLGRIGASGAFCVIARRSAFLAFDSFRRRVFAEALSMTRSGKL
jgi:hypothetical protein